MWDRLKVILVFCALLVAVCLPAAIGWSQGSPDPKIVEGAKKEGEVIYYTTMTLDQSKTVVDRFQAKYPFVKPTLFRTGGGPLLNKIMTEVRGGRHAWDVLVGRGEMVLPLMEKKLLASYISPETKMIDSQLVDKEGYWRSLSTPKPMGCFKDSSDYGEKKRPCLTLRGWPLWIRFPNEETRKGSRWPWPANIRSSLPTTKRSKG